MKLPLLSCSRLSKYYQEGDNRTSVLTDVEFTIHASEQVAILGSSGSGKSTLLHLLGALDRPSSGTVLFKGKDIFSFSAKAQAQFRNQSLGFVYQLHHLLPEFSALENVAMPLLIGKMGAENAKARAEIMLEKVGLSHRISHKPSQLSGGERQRVAIARALVNEPEIVLADEPTGNLDHKTGESIYALLSELREVMQTSFVVVTHDNQLAAKLDRTLLLHQGKLDEVAR
ncbi:lipoprotein-releasing ABC transporter ATP-binding protein LolD [Aestuariibacter sp. AA17]|uniref:Lipoprotein-releasing system ATP-binding protein LolD n=1 Tax=Fluctibacter corallii TaxID=2984329 RepID=A0ABT3A5R6_9ALTE|nr:lipoprotein-releasing ABC transporter ATP-binding protein LolD [Aestuariibacter sp. AA17]MCV2883999.1 lipoprotein-releasing ABC transporter ATP-binding protein LolD [Aestuariibacter sp. AA17]